MNATVRNEVRSFLDLDRISASELRRILDIAAELKKNRAAACLILRCRRSSSTDSSLSA